VTQSRAQQDHEVGRDRQQEVRRVIDTAETAEFIGEGQFSALGMLVTDASLAGDEASLEEAQDGLQWLYRARAAVEAPSPDQLEQRGRLLGMIDITHWALRRLPSALQIGLDPSTHAARFLLGVAEQPGLSNQAIAAQLGIDQTQASRIGRRLLAAGVVWRRREWRRNSWDITPRGRDYLKNVGLLSENAAAGSGALKLAVGVKILPGRLIASVVDGDARELASREQALAPSLEPAREISRLADLVRELIAQAPGADECEPDSLGLGVEVGGHVSTHSGRVVYAPNYGPDGGWNDFPLREALEKATALPTVIENDANAIAEYEHAFGSGRGSESFAAIVIDEGIGCGLISHGRLVHGIHAMAGEIGHIVVEPDGRSCRCGNSGCLDSVASTLAISQIFGELAGHEVPDAPDLPNVVAQFEQGDKDAEAALDRAGDALGRAISAVLNLANPEKLVLYGPAALVSESDYKTAELFMSCVRKSSDKYTFSTAGRDCTLIPKTFSYDVGARAAAAVALLRAR
jgi:predicted NBD/HSP70 family sugar kinase/predicted transcriptional regulator